jgi:hypothetical protein
MSHARSMLTALAILAVCTTSAQCAFSQEPGGEPERTRKLKLELSQIDAMPKAGDEVVALRDVELMVETTRVGSVRKGERLSVQRVKDDWLWVRTGNVRGWVDNRSVVVARLMDWCQRLPDNTSVTLTERTRARFAGILFQIRKAGDGPALISDSDGSIYGISGSGRLLNAAYQKVRIVLEEADNGNSRMLWLTFDPPGGAAQQIPPPPDWTKGASYGTARQGDCVSIDTQTRQVFVNGEHRTAE